MSLRKTLLRPVNRLRYTYEVWKYIFEVTSPNSQRKYEQDELDNLRRLYGLKELGCRHWNSVEIGLIEGDEFGCKIVECLDCDKVFDSHRRIYGCRRPEAI